MYFLLRERWFHLQIDIVAAKARHESAFRHCKPQLRPPRCDSKVTPEEKRRFLARRAQETEQRRFLLYAETDAEEA